MTIRRGSIVALSEGDEWSADHYRVEMVVGNMASLRNLTNFTVSKEPVDQLALVYQTDRFDTGDIVRVRTEYKGKYSEVNGENDLTVVRPTANVTVSTIKVENNNGEQFDILTERLYLKRPGKSFKEGDRVVVDLDLAKKYDYDGIADFWRNAGVLVLTEDSGSRSVQYTSHIRYENKDESHTNNVPTRWLKLYEEPAKRVVGETIKAADIKVGDTIKASFKMGGLLNEFTGVVATTVKLTNEIGVHAKDDDGAFGSAFPYESRGAVYTLLEEAPEPVDENLQRLLDAEVGDIAFGTYADEYWKKVGDGEWKLVGDPERPNVTANTGGVFMALFRLKYGELHIYRRVEDAD